MKKLIYILMTILIFAAGCSKKEKKYIPLSILQNDSAGQTTTSSVSGSNTNAAGETTITRISVSPSETSIAKDTNASYTATAIYSDGTIKDITNDSTWSVATNADKAQVDATKKGRFLGTSSGQAKVNAKFESLTGDANLNITGATLVSIEVSRVTNLSSGATAQYTATGIFSDGTTQDISSLVTWITGNSSVININSTGMTTEVGPGSTTISASLQGRTGSTNTIVSAITISYVTVTGSASIAAGTSSTYRAIATYSNGTAADITILANWNVDNSSTATVGNTSGAKGSLSALTTGNVSVQATYMNITGAKDVAVTTATVTSLSLAPTVSIVRGTTYAYTLTANYSDGTSQNVSNSAVWTSSDTTVAGVTTSPTNGGSTQGLLAGNADITASFGGKSVTSNLTVTAGTLVSISIGGNANVNKGETKQYTATGTYSDGSTQDISSLVSWSSSNSSVCSISNAVADKGKAYADGVGSSTVTATLSGITGTGTITVTGVASSQTVSGYNVTIPGQLAVGSTPTGNFTGLTYNGATNAAGFISAIPDYSQTSCGTLGAYVLGLVINDTPDVITGSNQVSSSTTNFTGGCTTVYNLSVTTGTGKKPTELSDHLIQEIGVNVANGTVSNLPSNQATESATTSFRVIVQVTHNAGGSEIVGVGVSSATDYASNEAILAGFLNGTNISSTSTTYANKSDAFVATADPLVDFIWVVDNSGSMSEEQSAVQNAATTFFNKLSNKHLNYRLGVIKTGGSGGSNSCTSPTTRAFDMNGNWTTASDGAAAFTTNVNVGTAGCGTESGIYSAEKALALSTIVPRSGAKVIFVMVSDEGDQWGCYQGTYQGGANNVSSSPFNPCAGKSTFDVNSNVFKTNGYKVYTVSGLNSTTGLSGTCAVAPTSAAYTNNKWSGYYDLAQSTGGSSASICSSDYNSIMDNIVTQAAGSSGYALSRTPLSSSISVKVNGASVSQDATNGWQYNAGSKTIIFSGTAWPSSGSSITVTYDYDTSVALTNQEESNLMAYISNTSESGTARGAAAAIAILVGAILAGRIWSNRKKQ